MSDPSASPQRPTEWDPTLESNIRAAADALLPVFYTDLKRIAQGERAKVGADITLQTTALVHEA